MQRVFVQRFLHRRPDAQNPGFQIIVVTTVDLLPDDGEVALRRVQWIGLPRKTDGRHLNLSL